MTQTHYNDYTYLMEYILKQKDQQKIQSEFYC